MASPAPRAARSSRPLRDRAYVPPTRRLRACAASLLYASDRPPASRRGADPCFFAAARRMRHAGHAEEACKAFPAGRVGKAAVASTFIVGGAALHAVGRLPAPGAILHGALRKMQPLLIRLLAGGYPVLDLNDPKQAHKDQRLRSDPIIWLCSVRPDGRPHAAAVWFLWDGSSILIFSMPTAQKLRNLRHEPRVILALDDTHAGDDPITLEGTAEILEPSVVTPQLPAYA